MGIEYKSKQVECRTIKDWMPVYRDWMQVNARLSGTERKSIQVECKTIRDWIQVNTGWMPVYRDWMQVNWSNMYWWTYQGQWWHFQLDYRWWRLTSAKQSPMDPRCTRSSTTNTTTSPWSYCFRAFRTELYSCQHSPRICMAEDARIHPTLLLIMYSMRSKQIAETLPLWFAKASPYSRSTLGFNLYWFHWTLMVSQPF